MEKDLKLNTAEDADCREQIEVAPQTHGAAFTSCIQVLIAIPTSLFLAIARKEHFYIHQLSLLACLIAWRVPWNRERHADANSVARREGCREVYTTPSIIHVSDLQLESYPLATMINHLLSSIISVHPEATTLPTRQSESGIWRGNETNGDTCFSLFERISSSTDAGNFEFKVDCLWPLTP